MAAAAGRLRGAAFGGLWILVTAVACYTTARAGLRLALVRDQVTPLGLPTGVALSCLLLLGLRIWPGIALAAFGVHMAIGPTLPVVGAITVGNTLAPLCAYFLLRKAGFRAQLDRLRDALVLVFLGAFASMLISATVGALAFVLDGAEPADRLLRTLSVWWTGDTMGVLVVVPLVLAVRSSGRLRLGAARWGEAAALVCGTLAVTAIVTHTSYDLLFLIFPFLIWAAFRFQHLGAAVCVFIVSVTATLAAVRRIGPFSGRGLVETMVTLQLFNGTVAVTALLLAAVITERDASRREIERAVQNLTRMAAGLEHGRLTLKGMVLDLLRAREGPRTARGRRPGRPPA